MTHLARAAVLLVLGVMALRLVVTGSFGWFIAQRMRLPLLGAAIVMLILGVAEYLAHARKGTASGVGADSIDGDPDPPAPGSAGPRVGWLLVLPLAVLVAVAPTGLGAAAANRVDAVAPGDTGEEYPPLDVGDGPVEMPVVEFVSRAAWDENRSLEDVTVELSGLVVNDPDVSDGFRLTKFLVGCCAADGLPVQVIVTGAATGYEDDTWVEVTGEWLPTEVGVGRDTRPAEIQADSIIVMPEAPRDPYESW